MGFLRTLKHGIIGTAAIAGGAFVTYLPGQPAQAGPAPDPDPADIAAGAPRTVPDGACWAVVYASGRNGTSFNPGTTYAGEGGAGADVSA